MSDASPAYPCRGPRDGRGRAGSVRVTVNDERRIVCEQRAPPERRTGAAAFLDRALGWRREQGVTAEARPTDTPFSGRRTIRLLSRALESGDAGVAQVRACIRWSDD